MAEAVILIGIQASGKSTFYSERFFRTHVRINLDMLNTRHREKALFRCCLDMEQSFVVDNTNPNPDDRARYLPDAIEADFRTVGYFFESGVEGALERNEARPEDERIPEVGIRATAKKMEPPSFEEGFDELHRVRIGDDGAFVVEPWESTDQTGES